MTPTPIQPSAALVAAADARRPWAWDGSVSEFLATSDLDLLAAVDEHYVALCRELPAASQKTAWRNEVAVLRQALGELGAPAWHIVFEFELPFEGGRRPDVVIIAGGSIIVLEFKEAPHLEQAHYDQVAAYARDLSEYHRGSHWRSVVPVLVAVNARDFRDRDGVRAVTRLELPSVLSDVTVDGEIDVNDWLHAGYAPLPSLVHAARRIFRHEALPHVRRAIAARIPEAVDLISHSVRAARQESRRRLILLTGAPGAGKTLVGLRVVYEESSDDRAHATFLSGNGPLVEVLQDALRSTVFVRDLHKFITTYGMSQRVPDQHVIVFDEAQRAWDRRYMYEKRAIDASEPDLLIAIGEKLPRWAALVGLVGTGQSIYSGEERGLDQWREALERASAPEEWDVWCGPVVADQFAGLAVEIHEDLELRTSIRSRRAEELDDWVHLVLEGRLREAEALSGQILENDFTMYMTRSLDTAREYLAERYSNHPDARFGLLASSQARNLARLGVDNEWNATRRMNVAKWFNAPLGEDESCCALVQPATEFQCQGLELDLPVISWGDDLVWSGDGWLARPRRRRYPLDDPVRLLLNSYRVLLTRGRDGFIIWVPDAKEFSETAGALELAGVRTLG